MRKYLIGKIFHVIILITIIFYLSNCNKSNEVENQKEKTESSFNNDKVKIESQLRIEKVLSKKKKSRIKQVFEKENQGVNNISQEKGSVKNHYRYVVELTRELKREKRIQVNNNLSFLIGMSGGLNFNKPENSNFTDSSLQAGLLFEVELFQFFKKSLSVSVELGINYTKKTYRLNQGEIHSQYINCPIIIKVKWPRNINIGIGRLSSTFGIGFDSNFKTESDFQYSKNDNFYNYETKKFNYGLIGSVGFEIKFKNFGIFMSEFRVSYGLSENLVDQDAYFSSVGYEDFSIKGGKTHSYGVAIGWKTLFGN